MVWRVQRCYPELESRVVIFRIIHFSYFKPLHRYNSNRKDPALRVQPISKFLVLVVVVALVGVNIFYVWLESLLESAG